MKFTYLNKELILSAWDGLKTHKLRSGLTTLGVIFGVAAVISMASIGEGAKQEALKQIKLMGASNIIVEESRPEEGEERTEAVKKNPKGLTIADARALAQIIPEIEISVPQRMTEVKVRAGSNEGRFNIVATTPDMFHLIEEDIFSGRALTDLDAVDYRRVSVLGWDVARELFPLKAPVDEEVKIGRTIVTVAGVLDRQTVGSEIQGIKLRNRNLDIYVPLETLLLRMPPRRGESEVDQIVVKFSSIGNLPVFAGLIEKILKRRHNGIKDFKVIVPEELLRQHQETQRIFNIVMGTIASISLLVGGIGIMNIMLASVLERTREIGIRRALGAKRIDIARQFLAEATLLSLSGGVVGVIFGIVLAQGISFYAKWETAVSIWSILIAVGVSAGVGIIFGYLPARRAAKLDPIAALRFE